MRSVALCCRLVSGFVPTTPTERAYQMKGKNLVRQGNFSNGNDITITGNSIMAKPLPRRIKPETWVTVRSTAAGSTI
jgi:hypothetical protein